MLWTILIVVLILALIGALPAWPHSQGYGWSPAAIILVILLVLIVAGRL